MFMNIIYVRVCALGVLQVLSRQVEQILCTTYILSMEALRNPASSG